jgi:hypothetical protein
MSRLGCVLSGCRARFRPGLAWPNLISCPGNLPSCLVLHVSQWPEQARTECGYLDLLNPIPSTLKLYAWLSKCPTISSSYCHPSKDPKHMSPVPRQLKHDLHRFPYDTRIYLEHFQTSGQRSHMPPLRDRIISITILWLTLPFINFLRASEKQAAIRTTESDDCSTLC